MNYGHPLQFGTFITPTNSAPHTAVALAIVSEKAGYDLVTFQDHPYQAAHLDTWTLLSWVAGQTKRIHLAANVLNLPLRQPAVVARAAASLDLLSNGRVELALGAGSYWDAIAAMGGRRLSPKQAVDALHEGIDIIRGMLDTSEPYPLRFDGTYYQLAGAERVTPPLHNIQLWLGAYKPRMLRLTGQKADGWLPSLPYLKAGDLQTGNQIIDEAAAAHGRDPREIRRLLNISGRFANHTAGFLHGPSQQWVEELLPFVVEDGIGTFILMSDDAHTIEQFAHEVAPALRQAAQDALGQTPASGNIRSLAVRSKRHDGIRYDEVPPSLADSVIEPGDVGYARVRSTYMRGGAPGIVFQVKDVPQLIEALAFARTHTHLPLSIRSGGHGISGRSTNHHGIVLDLGKLNQIEVVDHVRRRVRVGPGARWMDVAAALAPHGWALSSGDYGGVGVGGLATSGGIGWLARQQGLTIDHLRAVEMVLADGSVVHASADTNADLFWAVRGAGANFGIVTSFEFEVEPIGNVGWGQLVLDASDTAVFLQKWGAIVESSPRDLTSFLIMGAQRPGQRPFAYVMSVINSDDPPTIVERLQPIADIAPLYDQQVYITSYANIMANAQQGGYHNGQGEPIARSGLIDHITPQFAAAIEQLLRRGIVHFFQIRSVGGAVADVPADETAYGYRSANFSVLAMGSHLAQMDAAWQEVAVHFDGLYLNFETDSRPERLHDAFPPQTLARLRHLKQQYDPTNLFRDNFNIPSETAVAYGTNSI